MTTTMKKGVGYGAADMSLYDGSVEMFEAEIIRKSTVFSFIPRHPIYGLAAAPVNGSQIQNAAWRNLADMAGVDEAAARYSTCLMGSAVGPAQMKMELSDAGLHGIVSQTAGTAQTFAEFQAPDAAKQFILDHSLAGVVDPTSNVAGNLEGQHRWGLIYIGRMTRAFRTDSGKVGNNAAIVQFGSATYAQGTMTGVANSANFSISGPENTGMSTTTGMLAGNLCEPALPQVVGQPTFRWMVSRGWNGGKPPTTGDFKLGVGWGTAWGQSQAGYQNASQSHELFEFHVIDLSIYNEYGAARAMQASSASSDKSFDYGDIFRVRGAAQSAFRRMKAPGGYIYGTTPPTDPATIP